MELGGSLSNDDGELQRRFLIITSIPQYASLTSKEETNRVYNRWINEASSQDKLKYIARGELKFRTAEGNNHETPGWIYLTLQRAIEDGVLDPNYLMGYNYLQLRNTAMNYAVENIWWEDWPTGARQQAAVDFLEKYDQPRKEFYTKLKSASFEPYSSIAAWVGDVGFPDPSTRDSNVDYLYEFQYPFIGYLYENVFTTFTTTQLVSKFGARGAGMTFKFSHTLPTLPQVKTGVGDIFEEMKPFLIGGLIIVGIGASASLVSAVRK